MLKLPDKPIHILQKFLAENKPLVSKYLVKRIKSGIEQDLDKVDLFEFTGPKIRHIAIVKWADYENVLEEAIRQCSKVEDYETAGLAKRTLELFRTKQVTNLINGLNNKGE